MTPNGEGFLQSKPISVSPVSPKEGKYAVNWTRLSCHDFRDNEVRLQHFALAYNLANFVWRRGRAA